MLLLTDSFYSGAATASSLLGVYLLSQGWQWWSVYFMAASALGLLILLALPSTYPEKPPQLLSGDRIRDWPASVFVCGFSLLLYLLAVVTIYSWVPNYAQTTLGMEAAAAGNLVGRFFTGMFFGQLLMFFIVLRAPIRPLLFTCLLLASIMTFGLWNNLPWLTISSAIFLLGFVGGGILKVAISYATTLLDPPSPKMVSYILFNTSLGTAIAPALSALVVEASDPRGALIFASACYILSTLMLLTTYSLQRRALAVLGS
jgi:TsgA-like MFS transporter